MPFLPPNQQCQSTEGIILEQCTKISHIRYTISHGSSSSLICQFCHGHKDNRIRERNKSYNNSLGVYLQQKSLLEVTEYLTVYSHFQTLTIPSRDDVTMSVCVVLQSARSVMMSWWPTAGRSGRHRSSVGARGLPYVSWITSVPSIRRDLVHAQQHKA